MEGTHRMSDEILEIKTYKTLCISIPAVSAHTIAPL